MSRLIEQAWQYIVAHPDKILEWTWQHLQIVLVAKHDWVVLQDDQNFWPPYDLSPVVRNEILAQYPEIEELLADLIAAFPSDPAEARAEMTALNAQVDNDLLEPEDVAREWLMSKGLIYSLPRCLFTLP